MIRVEIDFLDVPRWATGGGSAFEMFVIGRLAAAGVPCIGGPLLKEVDLSKGVLTSWHDPNEEKMIYTFQPPPGNGR